MEDEDRQYIDPLADPRVEIYGFASCSDDPACVLKVQTTTLVALMMAGTLAGVAMFVIGNRRLGSLISFVPFPVQCAFLAACGFKIFKAGLYLMMTLGATHIRQLWPSSTCAAVHTSPHTLQTALGSASDRAPRGGPSVHRQAADVHDVGTRQETCRQRFGS